MSSLKVIARCVSRAEGSVRNCLTESVYIDWDPACQFTLTSCLRASLGYCPLVIPFL